MKYVRYERELFKKVRYHEKEVIIHQRSLALRRLSFKLYQIRW